MGIRQYIWRAMLFCSLACAVMVTTSCSKGGGSSKLGILLAVLMNSNGRLYSVDAPYVSGSQSPDSVIITITPEQQSLSSTWYFKVLAYSSLKGRSISDPSSEQSISLSGPCPCSIKVAWSPNPEPAVNRSGGGYTVYYNYKQNFSIR